MDGDLKRHKIGWIGTGRMGFPMAERLAKAGCDLTAYNRTRAKAEPLTKSGAKIAASPAELASCDIVFTMVSASDDLKEVTISQGGVLAVSGRAPKILVDCSTVSEEASAEVRVAASKRGTQMLAAPVSGNGKVVKVGKLTIVASGPKDAYDAARPYLDAMGKGSSYAGEGELARIVKICHNVLLGVVIQNLVEITVLAEKCGVKRHAFLDFINKSVMGSLFTAYKTPALVNLDMSPTFTPVLLKKDLDLGLAAARKTNTPMPVTAATRELVQNLIGLGYADKDFATLIFQQAKNSGLDIKPENVEVPDGLH
ncbi:MAG: NAD(P)-dependent oxidoreductase [Stellaceae bacterium]|jgi:3-hydroxyisobutyrate dehydrogenase-like beta-hydroxyacid dehydrogenase